MGREATAVSECFANASRAVDYVMAEGASRNTALCGMTIGPFLKFRFVIVTFQIVP
jgi:hypothetical protein